MKAFLAFVAALSLLTACGAVEAARTPTDTDRSRLAGDRTETHLHDDSCSSELVTHRVRSPRFSIGVPAGWGIYDRETPATDEEIALYRKADPSFAAYLEVMRKPNSPFVLFAVRCVADRGYATNMNVLAFPISTDEGFDDFRAGAFDGIAETGAKPEIQELTLPAGKAVKLSYERELGNRELEVTVAVTQYLVYAKGNAYILTYGTLPELENDWADVFDASARSFRAG
jgi:hypothetical protein